MNGDSLSLAVFGVTNTILTMMFLIIIKGIGETVSLKAIKSKSDGDHSDVLNVFIKGGLLSFGLFFIFTMICLLSK
jgi:hypothetical protein